MTAPPVFVISLAREPERRARMAQELTGFGFEFFDAIDGTALGEAEYAHRMDREWFRIMRGRELAPGEIGCFLSHYGVWEKIAAERMPVALVLEDDARLEDRFREVVEGAMKLHDEWDVVYLARMKKPLRITRMVALLLDGSHRLIQCRRRTGGVGYLIRREAAEALLHHCWRIRAPIDYLYTGWWENGLRVMTVDPAIVRHAGMPSTIALNGKWPKLKRTLLERAAGYLYRKADMLLSRACAKSK